MAVHYLEFERPIADLEAKIEELSKLSETAGPGAFDDEIDALRARAQEMRKEAYANLDAWQKTLVARHPDRPHFVDYVAGADRGVPGTARRPQVRRRPGDHGRHGPVPRPRRWWSWATRRAATPSPG